MKKMQLKRMDFIWFMKYAYIAVLMQLLPLLIRVLRHLVRGVQTELDYLKPGYTFMVSVAGTKLSCICRRTQNASVQRIKSSWIATDCEPGSGLKSADRNAVCVDYVINFRSLSHAFDVFFANTSLRAALANRAFTTRGPNNTGVALTYMFTAILKVFFFWRSAYAPENNYVSVPQH